MAFRKTGIMPSLGVTMMFALAVMAFRKTGIMPTDICSFCALAVQLQCSGFFVRCKCKYGSWLLCALLLFSVIYVLFYLFLFPFGFDTLGRYLDFCIFKWCFKNI